MYPPIFAVCSSNPGVQAALGSSPCRVFMFGHAPQGTTKPYAVWQLIGGSPENYLATRPDADNWSLQIDVYATTGELARSAAQSIRDAIEPVSYVIGWRGESRDTETKNYRVSFDVDWITNR